MIVWKRVREMCESVKRLKGEEEAGLWERIR